jgi:hypothetical protein
MLVSSEKLAVVFQKVKQVKEHTDLYCLVPDNIPVSIEELQHVVSDMYGLNIEKTEVAFQAEFIRGMLERYEDGRNRILIKADQSKDMKRLATAKELSQLVIDEAEDWSPKGADTIDGGF